MTFDLADMSDEEKYLLLELSYLDVPPQFSDVTPVGEVLDRIVHNKSFIGTPTQASAKQLQIKLKKYPGLRELKLLTFLNNNYFDHNCTTKDKIKTGFAGYVLEDEFGNRIFLFRGTEPDATGKLTQDMLDNSFSFAVGESPQISEAKQFFAKYKVEGKTNLLLGHSKGGNLALEVFIANLALDIKAYVVNGQPLNIHRLSVDQIQALISDRLTFISHLGDVVTYLGIPFYIDKIVKTKGDSDELLYPHHLESVAFDQEGNLSNSCEGIELYRAMGALCDLAVLGKVDGTRQILQNLIGASLAINDTINTAITGLHQNITACQQDIETIDKAIESGFKLLLEDIQGILIQLSLALTEDLELIIEGVTQVLASNTDKDFGEKIKLVLGIFKTAVGGKELIFDPSKARNEILRLMCREIESTLETMVAELQDLLMHSTRLVTTLAKACKDLWNGLTRGLGQLGTFWIAGDNGTDQAVIPDRLRDLGKQLRRLNDGYEQHVYESVKAVSRLLSQINVEYDETYVCSASAEVRHEIEQLARLYDGVKDKMYEKEQVLKRAADTYEDTEARIKRGIDLS